MAQKFDVNPLLERLNKEKAAREEREAKANIDWRKKLKLMPWQSLKDVELPDEFYESMLIKIQDIDPLCRSYIRTICDIFAMSIDYAPYSEDWNLAMKYMYTKFQLPDGNISPILPALVYSMIEIATKDAREKKVKTMKEWRETIKILTEKMLPKDEEKVEMVSEISSLKLKISELEGKLKEAERIDKHRIEEIDRWHAESKAMDGEAGTWHAKYDDVNKALLKAEHERDLYKKILESTPSGKKFKVRQIAIIALALCRKALVVPKNKKKIAVLFSHMTGASPNTISQNLCDTYNDQEIQDIAEPLKESMPELAEYLLENRFAG